MIDIGANIGDSCIYFALRGATKVIGFEPFPKSYDTAIRNIQKNDFGDRVVINLAACSNHHGTTNVSSDTNGDVYSYLGSPSSSLPSDTNIRQVPLITLEDIIDEYAIEGDVMKVDCEGCEYDIILCTPETALSRFSYIQIEYHDGYIDLRKKLERSGFNVVVDRPKLAINPIDKTRKYSYGNLYARRERS